MYNSTIFEKLYSLSSSAQHSTLSRIYIYICRSCVVRFACVVVGGVCLLSLFRFERKCCVCVCSVLNSYAWFKHGYRERFGHYDKYHIMRSIGFILGFCVFACVCVCVCLFSLYARECVRCVLNLRLPTD